MAPTTATKKAAASKKPASHPTFLSMIQVSQPVRVFSSRLVWCIRSLSNSRTFHSRFAPREPHERSLCSTATHAYELCVGCLLYYLRCGTPHRVPLKGFAPISRPTSLPSLPLVNPGSPTHWPSLTAVLSHAGSARGSPPPPAPSLAPWDKQHATLPFSRAPPFFAVRLLASVDDKEFLICCVSCVASGSTSLCPASHACCRLAPLVKD